MHYTIFRVWFQVDLKKISETRHWILDSRYSILDTGCSGRWQVGKRTIVKWLRAFSCCKAGSRHAGTGLLESLDSRSTKHKNRSSQQACPFNCPFNYPFGFAPWAQAQGFGLFRSGPSGECLNRFLDKLDMTPCYKSREWLFPCCKSS